MIFSSLRKSKKFLPFKEAIKALGIVFGDIGTSPIYTLAVIFAIVPIVATNVLGVLSLIIWTLILLVSVQYAWLAMSLSQKGEGGTIVLREILTPLLKSPRMVMLATFLSFIGISFLIGDGVITPAISILSAVEGLKLVPAFAFAQQNILILIACIISILLFAFQRMGTEVVSVAFGPIMLLWFISLGTIGFSWLLEEPWVIQAIFPWHAINFVRFNGVAGFLVLSKVILCATGGEALYADMGHLGRKPIIRAWLFAFAVLFISYLGQGAYLLKNPQTSHIFYGMIFDRLPLLYIPFLALSICATVIASQAMISGIFSIVYQGITTNIMPKLKIDYTSRKLRSQIYIPFINWSLLLLVLFAILEFREAYNLANAYGLAAICTMTITSIMMIMIFFLKKQYLKMMLALGIAALNATYLAASTSKIAYGGYISLMIALIPLSIILIFTRGKKRLDAVLSPINLQTFLDQFQETRNKIHLIEGTGLFFSKNAQKIPSYIAHTCFVNNIMYEDTIIVSVVTQDKPFGISASFREKVTEGLRVFEIRVGYMEIMNLPKILKAAHIEPKVIFYGMEDIETKHIVWKIFALIKKLTPSFVQFYKLPADILHGVVMRVEM